nr:Protein of unknown function (DUF423) [uncultured bacterium]
MANSVWIKWGSAMMFLAIALGAFAAHGLKSRLSESMLAAFEAGVRYQVYHALALFIVAWLADRNPGNLVFWAGTFFLIGILLFSGSLYALSLTGIRGLGAITPLGGLSFLTGWAILFLTSCRTH